MTAKTRIDFQKANPLGDAPCSEPVFTVSAFRGHPGDQFPASPFAGGKVTISKLKKSSIGFSENIFSGRRRAR